MIFDMAVTDFLTRRIALGLTGTVLVAFLVSGCGKKVLSRDRYVRIRIMATLRAREKGTAPEEELVALLESSGVPREVFEETRVRWFGRDSFQEIRRGLRSVLETPGPLSRTDYIQYRVRVYLRSRIRNTRFEIELQDLARVQGFTVQAFRAAEEIWRGESETDREIEELHESLVGARAVPWEVWEALTSRPEWSGESGEDWLDRELERRGISRIDWSASEDLHRLWEQEDE